MALYTFDQIPTAFLRGRGGVGWGVNFSNFSYFVPFLCIVCISIKTYFTGFIPLITGCVICSGTTNRGCCETVIEAMVDFFGLY